MRAFIPCSLASVSLAVILSGPVLAQPVEEPDEIIVRAKPLSRYRAEIEVARDEMVRLFNEANEDDENDVQCRYEAPTGSRIPVRVCFSAAQDRASANAARAFLQALSDANGSAAEGSVTGIGAAQNAAGQESRAIVKFEEEWQRLMGTNQQFHDAVVKYRELEDEFDRTGDDSYPNPGPRAEGPTMRGQHLHRVQAARQRCARHGQGQYLGVSGGNDWEVRGRRAR